MVRFVEKALDQLGVANVQLHKTMFQAIQPVYLLAKTALYEIPENEEAFLGMMSNACHQQPEAGFLLVRGMFNQSKLDDVVIIVGNKCVRPRAKNEEDPFDAAGELYCTEFASVESVGRPLIVPTVARGEEWSQPWARHPPPDNKEYWPSVQSLTGRCTGEISLKHLVRNNRVIVDWETFFDLALLGIGVCSTLM